MTFGRDEKGCKMDVDGRRQPSTIEWLEKCSLVYVDQLSTLTVDQLKSAVGYFLPSTADSPFHHALTFSAILDTPLTFLHRQTLTLEHDQKFTPTNINL